MDLGCLLRSLLVLLLIFVFGTSKTILGTDGRWTRIGLVGYDGCGIIQVAVKRDRIIAIEKLQTCGANVLVLFLDFTLEAGTTGDGKQRHLLAMSPSAML